MPLACLVLRSKIVFSYFVKDLHVLFVICLNDLNVPCGKFDIHVLKNIIVHVFFFSITIKYHIILF